MKLGFALISLTSKRQNIQKITYFNGKTLCTRIRSTVKNIQIARTHNKGKVLHAAHADASLETEMCCSYMLLLTLFCCPLHSSPGVPHHSLSITYNEL